ncbi:MULTISPECIES: DUF3095 family protein [unclassified Rhizobium]|uniref:DUF3095 family protein n=1 Tax=unclassified Rhizobium TaxID=2613769 RepID=UPI00105074A6|nr:MULTISPECIES: DUF3095 family protein [unclassified Rhizobium]MBB3394929.1 hypothetical protein [Rhizobium sp. BK060]MBB4167472.1 hypothetical protein [Rhizobium sp. BK538]TCM78529.1 DUF3095 family protein [Rhizobium sp. BK068]
MDKAFRQLKASGDFAELLDTTLYIPLPDDWMVGITDVVDSTSAIARGQHKDVNYAGASAIAAIGNAFGNFDFPFVFRGDGAAFAFDPGAKRTAVGVLRRVAGYARDQLQLNLRIGLVAVGDLRAAGWDVKVAHFAASETATYAMFAGGGLDWADREIKAGNYALSPCEEYTAPDLKGLTCEWAPIPSQRGDILSLLVEPQDHATPDSFTILARQLLTVLGVADGSSRPVPDDVVITDDVADYLGGKGWADVVLNSDYRRYDDVLRLTVDCTLEQTKKVVALLSSAKERGEVYFGLHRQSHAIMTCLVPLDARGSHLHFLDGMGGGYTAAASLLEAQKSTPVALKQR